MRSRQQRRVTPPSSTSSRRVPRFSPSPDSKDSSASSYASSSPQPNSPDARIFKGAEILRSELFSPKGDLWSVSESNHSFNDDNWSDPWSVPEGHFMTSSFHTSVSTGSSRSQEAAVVSSSDSSDTSPATSSTWNRRSSQKKHREAALLHSPDAYEPSPATSSTWNSFSSQKKQQRKSLPIDEDGVLTDEQSSVSSHEDPSMHLPPRRRSTLAASQDNSVVSSDSEPPPPPARPPPARPPPEPSLDDFSEFGSVRTDDTPTTTMGRDSSLRFKTVTYLVESSLDELTVDDENDDALFDDARDQDDCDQEVEIHVEKSGYVPSKYHNERGGSLRSASSSKYSSTSLGSTFMKEYAKLRKDPAYVHARNAGVAWQTLVGQHVKFPKTWWDGARGPSLGMEDASGKYWQYIARHRVFGNEALKAHVRTRSSCGRLLLHIIVRDLLTFVPLQDIVVGCLHPNARGIRETPRPKMSDEDCREVWMAIRKRPAALDKNAAPSLIDPLLTRGYDVDEIANDSPLGSKRKVNNTNMRAVFGEKPPVDTLFINESELYERLITAEELDSFAAPALVLLQEFLHSGLASKAL